MGNKDYLSGVCDLTGKRLYEKLYKTKDKKKKKKKNTENDYMIMSENLNKKLEQKSYTECVTHKNYYSVFPAHPSPLYPGSEPPSPRFSPPPKERKKIRFGFFVKINLLENSK